MNSSPKYINKGGEIDMYREIYRVLFRARSTKLRFVDSFNDYRALALNE